MKRIEILLLMLLPIVGHSQEVKSTSHDIYQSAKALSLVDRITWEYLKKDFSFGSPFVNYIFKLGSNNTFEYIEFGDVATITLDHGTWHIRKKNTLVLKSKKMKYSFDIVKFDKFLFFILQEQRSEFVTDFTNEQKEAATYKTDPNQPMYTKEWNIVFNLRRKYYCTD